MIALLDRIYPFAYIYYKRHYTYSKFVWVYIQGKQLCHFPIFILYPSQRSERLKERFAHRGATLNFERAFVQKGKQEVTKIVPFCK